MIAAFIGGNREQESSRIEEGVSLFKGENEEMTRE